MIQKGGKDSRETEVKKGEKYTVKQRDQPLFAYLHHPVKGGFVVDHDNVGAAVIGHKVNLVDMRVLVQGSGNAARHDGTHGGQGPFRRVGANDQDAVVFLQSQFAKGSSHNLHILVQLAVAAVL